MHLFQPWKTLTCSMQLLSAYKRLPPIRCFHPNHGSCSNHRQVSLKDRCVSNLPCIQCSLLQILLHVFEPPILCKVMMISSLLAYSLSKGIMPRWHKNRPCRRAMSLMKHPILLLLNKVVPPSCASTRSKSKNAPQSSLGPVAPFVANLRGQALPRQSTTSVGPHRPMLSRDIEGVPTNNVDNGNERLPPIRALGRARRPREDGPRRDVTKQTNSRQNEDQETRRFWLCWTR
jgi:hypothetical protein